MHTGITAHQNISPPAVLLKALAGDLILWDSRTLHGGRVGTGRNLSSSSASSTSSRKSEDDTEITGSDACACLPPPPSPFNLARLAVTVCMTPRALASAGVLAARQKGFKKGYTFTHWPHEAIMTGMMPSTPTTTDTNRKKVTAGGGEIYVPVELPERVLELI